MRCENCRFWSERLAQAIGGGPVEAYCLVQGGPLSGKYTAGYQGCELGKDRPYGAIDDPYEDWKELERLYAEHDAAQVDERRER